MKIEEMNTLKQITAAILLTQRQHRIITHLIETSEWLAPCYPEGTRYFLVRSELASDHSEWFDSVYWLHGRCVVVAEKEIWQVTRAAVIESLLAPIPAK